MVIISFKEFLSPAQYKIIKEQIAESWLDVTTNRMPLIIGNDATVTWLPDVEPKEIGFKEIPWGCPDAPQL